MTLAELRNDIQIILKNWHASQFGGKDSLPDLELVKTIQRAEGIGTSQAIKQMLARALDKLASEQQAQAQLLKLHYLQKQPMQFIAEAQHRAVASVYRDQQRAIARLSEIVYHDEAEIRSTRKQELLHRLGPPTSDRLFGVDTLLADLQTVTQPANRPPVILIHGIGGIGKTTLADALVRWVIDRLTFSDFAWITSKQQTFKLDGRIENVPNPVLTAEELLEGLITQLMPEALPSPFSVERAMAILERRLASLSHLIVIDNLETLQNVEVLLPVLRRLAGQAKVILTSRETLPAEPGIYHYPVPELSKAAALELIRHEASTRRIPQVVSASDNDLSPIYDTVGGNPLALRLVVGQMHAHDIPTILASLREAQGKSVEELYTFIYRTAWNTLNDVSHRAFLAMPLLPIEGGSFSLLREISGLEAAELYDAVEELTQLNLIEPRGNTVYEGRYSIHSLTRSFLNKQVARWR